MMLEDDQYQKELIWILSERTGLTQKEIAGHPFVRKSQPTVSRILNNYDPAFDGFEYGTGGFGGYDDKGDLQEEALEEYREAVANLLAASPDFTAPVKTAEAGVHQEIFGKKD
ncbi:hypothetical protein ACYJ1Y_18290 [Natrialbaceae archaeon A-gly3]